MAADLSNFMNTDLTSVIQSLTVQEGKAKETGQPYFYLNLVLVNGYEKRLFLNAEEKFAWVNALEKAFNE